MVTLAMSELAFIVAATSSSRGWFGASLALLKANSSLADSVNFFSTGARGAAADQHERTEAAGREQVQRVDAGQRLVEVGAVVRGRGVVAADLQVPARVQRDADLQAAAPARLVLGVLGVGLDRAAIEQ